MAELNIDPSKFAVRDPAFQTDLVNIYNFCSMVSKDINLLPVNQTNTKYRDLLELSNITLREFTPLILNLNLQKKTEEARSLLFGISDLFDFAAGAGKSVYNKYLNQLKSLPECCVAGFALSKLMTKIPAAVGPAMLTLALYNLGSNSGMIYKDFQEMTDAIIKLDFTKAGEHAGKIGMSALDVKYAIKGFKELYNNFKAKGWQAIFGDGIKAGVQDAELQKKELAKTQATFSKIQKSENYERLAKIAKSSGMPLDSYNKRVKQLCTIFGDEKEILLAFDILEELTKLQRVFKLSWLSKPLTFDLEHLFGIVIKLGNIKGGHSIKLFELGNSRVKISHEEHNSSGIWRAIIEFAGYRPKESIFFPKEWSGKKTLEKIYEALKTVDISKVKPNKNGEIQVIGNTSEGILIEMIINIEKCRINSAYPIHKDWPHGSLLKKIFGNEN